MIADKFHGQISRQQAEKTPVYEFIADHAADFPKSEDVLRNMVQSYITAWNLCVNCTYCKFNYSNAPSNYSTVASNYSTVSSNNSPVPSNYSPVFF